MAALLAIAAAALVLATAPVSSPEAAEPTVEEQLAADCSARNRCLSSCQSRQASCLSSCRARTSARTSGCEAHAACDQRYRSCYHACAQRPAGRQAVCQSACASRRSACQRSCARRVAPNTCAMQCGGPCEARCPPCR